MAHFITTPAPHVHSGDSVRRNMLLVILALMPAYVVSVLEFGIGALITAAVSVAACVLIEWLISRFLLKESGKSINPFNPALVGRVFLLISFPQQMTTWPVANGFETSYVDAQTGATPLYYLKHLIGLSNGSEAVDTANALPSLWDSLMGAMGGSLGEVCALALIIGGIFLIAMRVITWHIPVAIIATVALFAACVSWFGGVPNEAISTGSFVAYELLTGGLMLGAFFMATDYVTSPMTAWGKIIFGVGIGVIMMVIRLLGNYPEGMSFAILIMNACVPLLNKFRPQRFGEKRK